MIGKQLPQPSGRFALTNGRVVLPYEVVEGVAVVVEDGSILGVDRVDTLGSEVEQIDVGGRMITPGLIDIHTHGAADHDFSEPTAEAYGAITQENVTRGVTSLLATVTTAPVSDMIEAFDFCRGWMAEPREGTRVIGVHSEGPYFSMEQKGAQDPKHIVQPDDGSADRLLEHHDVITMMTYAPEVPGALELTRRLVALGIVAAAGHSNARDTEIREAMDVGLSHAIHIWSGQSSTIRIGAWRKPGLLEATLVFDDLTAEMITDHKHLPATLMKLAYKCKGPDKLCSISDATGGAGLPKGTVFGAADMQYIVGDGVAMLLDGTRFAGSTTLLNRMVPILLDVVEVPLPEAVRMVTRTPARIIHVDDHKGSLEPGKDADIAVFDDDWTAWRTMIGGRWAYAA